MRKNVYKRLKTVGIVLCLTLNVMIIYLGDQAIGGSYNGEDLAYAILADPTVLLSSSYTDEDESGHRQSAILSTLGTMNPTEGSTFVLLSTGIAGANPVTTDGSNPGDERGSYFHGKHKTPRDKATLTLDLQVPFHMNYLYYDVQFFTAEYPEYVGSKYDDRFTVTVDSPSKGETTFIFDVSSGDFVLDADDIPGTGFDIYPTIGEPDDVDWVSTTPGDNGADAGASALITREHPVSPDEQITVTFEIEDKGDNQFDSTAFIDNLMFSGYKKTDFFARKTLLDVNGDGLECNDTLQYSITISNSGSIDQDDNSGNEFEDPIPTHTTYVEGSATATSGVIEYNAVDNKIIWNGAIQSESSVALTYDVVVNEGLEHGTIISNQGTVYWDSDEDNINDATELTDDPLTDDSIDQDGDGETDDDDPTNIAVFVFIYPSMVTEDFSDDDVGSKATQSYYGNTWFETSTASLKSYFEVAPVYHYSITKSFKIQLRAINSPHYWNYTLSDLHSDMLWWETWFTCGNVSEAYELYLDFKNNDGNDIAKLKIIYVNTGTDILTDYVLELYYWDNGWIQLASDFSSGYLFNDWYKLRIEKNGSNYINYSLYHNGAGLVDFKIGNQCLSPFMNFSQVKWSTTINPTVCPMFFFDEHNIGLTEAT